MKEKCKKFIAPFLIILFFLAFYFINKGIVQMDDKVYGAAFNSLSTCIKWVNEFYHLWSGRITLTILINIFNNMPIEVFKITNSIIFVLCIVLIYIISCIINNKNDRKNIYSYLIIIFSMIFFISIPVINSGALWLAGAMNYLWPAFGMLISIIPFIAQIQSKKINNLYYIVFILSNLLSCFAEQTSAILIVFGAITIGLSLIEKRKIEKTLLIHYVIIIIFSFINLLAPGNEARSIAEELRWYQGFGMLSTIDKLVQGYIQVANHIINDTTLLFGIMSIILSILIWKNKETKKTDKFISLIPVLYVLLKAISIVSLKMGWTGLNQIELLFNFERFGIRTLYTHTNLILLIASCISIAIVACELVIAIKRKRAGIISSILYCASICASLILSFSPTIYASGNRVFLLTDFLFVLINSLLIMEFMEKIKSKKVKIIVVSIIAIFAIICYINLWKRGINDIIY